MSTDPDHDGKRAALTTGALVLLPVLCCGLPLLIAAGALAGLGSVLGNPWVIGATVVLLVGVVLWQVHRRTGSAAAYVGRGCCAPESPTQDQSRSTTESPTHRQAQ